MTCNLNIVKNFRVSRTLFTKEDGSPTLFYTNNPCDALREIIEKGGGLLVDDDTEEECVKLCQSHDDPNVKNGYLPLSYIKHCVMKNHLIDEQLYRQNYLNEMSPTLRNSFETSDPDFNDNVNEAESSQSSSSPSKPNHILCPPVMGRKKYTMDEDLKIIRHLINHHAHRKVRGNRIWLQMEALQITNHSYQSMKDRYLKCILPTIHQYNIPDAWTDKLTRKYPLWVSDDEEENTDEEEERQENDEDEEQQSETFAPSDNDSDTSTSNLSTEFTSQLGSGGNATNSDKISLLKHKMSGLEESPEPSRSKAARRIGEAIRSPSRGATGEKRTTSSLSSATATATASCDEDTRSSALRVNTSDAESEQDVYRYGKCLGKLTHDVKSRVADGQEGECSRHSRARGERGIRDNFASQQLTQHRIEAIMKRYDITKEEAAYVFLQHPSKFWPAS